MSDLETRLSELGDRLDLDGSDALAGAVLARLDDPPPAGTGGRTVWLRAAAAVLVVAAIVLVAIPDARRSVAGWFGFDQVRIERRPDVAPGPPPDVVSLPGPGDSRVVEVDGRSVLISTIDGRLGHDLIRKNLGAGSAITEVEVAGRPALWIDGEPHEVVYRAAGGDVLVERVAGDTLLWQDGTLLYRVEGFDELDDALAFARVLTVGPAP